MRGNSLYKARPFPPRNTPNLEHKTRSSFGTLQQIKATSPHITDDETQLPTFTHQKQTQAGIRRKMCRGKVFTFPYCAHTSAEITERCSNDCSTIQMEKSQAPPGAECLYCMVIIRFEERAKLRVQPFRQALAVAERRYQADDSPENDFDMDEARDAENQVDAQINRERLELAAKLGIPLWERWGNATE